MLHCYKIVEGEKCVDFLVTSEQAEEPFFEGKHRKKYRSLPLERGYSEITQDQTNTTGKYKTHSFLFHRYEPSKHSANVDRPKSGNREKVLCHDSSQIRRTSSELFISGRSCLTVVVLLSLRCAMRFTQTKFLFRATVTNGGHCCRNRSTKWTPPGACRRCLCPP